MASCDSQYARQLAAGLCRFAHPQRGFVVREFFLTEDRRLPTSFQSWEPAGIVAFVVGIDQAEVAPLAATGLPIVHTSRAPVGEHQAVVIGDATEVYRTAHRHFGELGFANAWHLEFDRAIEAFGAAARYREFCAQSGLEKMQFVAPDSMQYDYWNRVERNPRESLPFSEELKDWLRSVPKPAAVFTQRTLGGWYLLRCCDELGIDVPGEVSVIGADTFEAATRSRPPATSFRVPGEAIGHRAGEQLDRMLRGEPAPCEIVTVPGVELDVRASTVPVTPDTEAVDAALRYISTHACEGITVNDVIAHTQTVSRMTFHSRFKRQAGMTPAAWIMNHRLRQARRLLANTQLSIGTVSAMCGFSEALYFYKVFRSQEGIGPRDYRKIAQKDLSGR